MDFNSVVDMDKKYYMNTFGDRTPLCFSHGRGLELYATDGKKYIDFFAGIAVSAVGHGHTRLAESIATQAKKLIHTSNLYYNEPQALLAKHLVELSCADRIFFASSGAEANEGAFKLSRMYFYKKGSPRNKFITLSNSFHGRTLATVAATGQGKYHKPYEPLMPEFTHVPANDAAALEKAVDDKTCALVLEVIQGESGVNPLSAEYMKLARSLCDTTGALLIIDEVQTGIGRTGAMFGYQHFGIEPDIFTLAKALGGGVPIGAICAKQFVADAFEPGDHGTTFGGNPLATAAALTVLDIIRDEELVDNSRRMGEYLIGQLRSLNNPQIAEVRGKGLMIGIEFKEEIAKEISRNMLISGYLTGVVGTKILRLLPPLIINKGQVDGFVNTLVKNIVL